MSRPMWFVSIIRKTFPYRYTAARMTRLPVVGRGLKKMLFEGDDIMLLPRVVSVSEDIDEAPGEVMPWQVIEHFIEEAGFLWQMDECICRRSAGCKDYPVDLGCLFLGEAARGINPRLGREVTRREASEHLARCREAGLFHLVGRNKLDAFWLDIGPGDRLLTICNCCTCCCLWKMLPQLSGDIASSLTRMPGVEVVVTSDCVACGTCLGAGCFAGAISLVDGRAVISDECRGCGRCAELCPNGAIEVRVENGPGAVPDAVSRLEKRVDVR
jgi:ferredoxin